MEFQSRAVGKLARTELFVNIPRESQRRMFSGLTLVQAPRCQSFSTSREQLYFVIDGRVRFSRVDPDSGYELTLFLFGAGDCFDAIAALGNEDHSDVIAVALDDVAAARVSSKAVEDWIDSVPQFRRALIPYLARQMHSLSEMATDFRFRDTQARLARLILNHVTHSDGTVGLIQDLSHDVLASMIGSVRQVVSRHLQELKREGAVEFHRGHLKVQDLEVLAQRATSALAGLPFSSPPATPNEPTTRARPPGPR